MNGLILSGAELLHCVDLGYKAKEDNDARFPIRLSSLGHCPRKQRALLEGAAKREFSARSLRIFEQGHQRGEALADALVHGLQEHILDLNHPGWRDLDPETLDLQVVAELAKRYEVLLEEEVWCPTNLSGERAERAVDMARKWQMSQGVPDPESLSVMIDPEGYLCVRGRVDVVIVDWEAKEFWVLDFKTKNSWGYKKLDEEGNGYDYEVQVLAYIRGFVHQQEGFSCRGAFLYYEDHDKRNHKVVPVDISDDWIFGVLDEAVDRVSKLLRNWVEDGPMEEALPMYAQPSKWTKKKHVGAAGCLPWQCNYCTVGPVAGRCIDEELYSIENIAGAYDEIPKWEVTEKR